jgi:diacylglycerol kinase (ATP)
MKRAPARSRPNAIDDKRFRTTVRGTLMRILVVHNRKAGSKKHQGDDFIKSLEKRGHEAIYECSKRKRIAKALEKKIDLVLVAGGDGTVGKVANRLVAANSEIPLSVLPIGTANNFARSLGFCLSKTELFEQLNDGKPETFDVGEAYGPWGKRYFFEGAGAGLFADYLRAPKEEIKKRPAKSKALKIRHHVKELRQRLQNYRAREWEIKLDDEDVSGRYLLWHAMNISSVGPVLTLAPNAKTNDGTFDFIGAREKDRATLLEYFDARAEGKQPKFPVRARRFKRMRLRWKKSPLHFDDELWPDEDEKERPRPCDIELTVKHSALRIWRIE